MRETAPGRFLHASPVARPSAERVFFVGVACATLAYGLALTVLLPWMAFEAISNGLAARSSTFAFVALGIAFMARWCLIQGLSFRELHRVRYRAEEEAALGATPFVSILVPAHNEAANIVQAVESLVLLDYPAFEVIVIDDGSEDDTFAKVSALGGSYGNCTVTALRKSNGGKASALNCGFKVSTGKLVLCVDADSRLDPEALRFLVERIGEDGVVAVCGQVSIRNRERLLARFQAIEYLFGNGGMRTALSTFGLVTLVPGPIGLYRRSVLGAIATLRDSSNEMRNTGAVRGPFSSATFAEDFQLSLSALALGGRVIYEPRAKAMTKCPEHLDSLLNQRYRWVRGTWQVFRLYQRELRGAVRQKRAALNLVMMAVYPIELYAAPILSLVFWVLLCKTAVSGQPFSMVAFWIGSIALLNAMAAVVYVIAHDEDFSLLWLLPFADLYQSLLINGAWVIAVIDELRGTRMKW